MKRKIMAGMCIAAGIAIMAVPFVYKAHGKNETDKLLTEFEHILEEKADEEEEIVPESEQASGSEEDTTLLLEEGVIGIIEIEAIDIRYPVGGGSEIEGYSICNRSHDRNSGTW